VLTGYGVTQSFGRRCWSAWTRHCCQTVAVSQCVSSVCQPWQCRNGQAAQHLSCLSVGLHCHHVKCVVSNVVQVALKVPVSLLPNYQQIILKSANETKFLSCHKVSNKYYNIIIWCYYAWPLLWLQSLCISCKAAIWGTSSCIRFLIPVSSCTSVVKVDHETRRYSTLLKNRGARLLNTGLKKSQTHSYPAHIL